jgi:hypothetical protein
MFASLPKRNFLPSPMRRKWNGTEQTVTCFHLQSVHASILPAYKQYWRQQKQQHFLTTTVNTKVFEVDNFHKFHGSEYTVNISPAIDGGRLTVYAKVTGSPYILSENVNLYYVHVYGRWYASRARSSKNSVQLVSYVVNKLWPYLRYHWRERKKRFLAVPRLSRRVVTMAATVVKLCLARTDFEFCANQ